MMQLIQINNKKQLHLIALDDWLNRFNGAVGEADFLSSDSCSSDNTVTIFENAKESRSMFKFNSFRFQRLEKVSTVWLHCEVQVCDGDRLVCQPVSSALILYINSS